MKLSLALSALTIATVAVAGGDHKETTPKAPAHYTTTFHPHPPKPEHTSPSKKHHPHPSPPKGKPSHYPPPPPPGGPGHHNGSAPHYPSSYSMGPSGPSSSEPFVITPSAQPSSFTHSFHFENHTTSHFVPTTSSMAPSAATGSLVPLYYQCGGIEWTAGTVCAPGAWCKSQNPFYYQCVAEATTKPTKQWGGHSN